MTISPREVSNSTDIPVVRKRSFKTAAVSLFITVSKSSTSCRSSAASWKVVVTGSKSEDDSDSRLASLKYASSEAWFQSKIFRVLSWAVVMSSYWHFCFYLFSGLIHCMSKPKVVLLIFVSGKTWIVLTGAKVILLFLRFFKCVKYLTLGIWPSY